jgi:choline dehydrogenase-like flavoprotein
MGGSIAAARAAEGGMRVLVLEAGRQVSAMPPRARGLRGALRRLAGPSGGHEIDRERWLSSVLLRETPSDKWRETRPFLGIGPGGSGRIYGAALARARRADFAERHDPADWQTAADPALPNAWPIAYDDLAPWYREAERLLRVIGERDPLDPDDDGSLGSPPALSPAHHRMREVLAANGRHPFAMHTGIGYRPGCWECQGTTCPRDCKSHGYNRALAPALAASGAPVTLRQGVDVRRIERAPGSRSWRVIVDGDEALEATRVILAAGALNTPRLLHKSVALWDGAVPAMIGAGAMFHFSDIFAVGGFEPGTLWGPRKVLAFRDHYRDGAMPLAEVQSMGLVPSAWMVARHLSDRAMQMGLPDSAFVRLATKVAGGFGARRYAGAELFTAAVEDLPYADNRVETVTGADGAEHIAVTYRPRPEMLARAERLRTLIREAFAPLSVDFLTRPGRTKIRNPMGTFRMGTDTPTTVTHRDGQVWGQEGLHIADASVFPSSLGINPALTIAANALRTAAIVAGRA